MYVSAGWQRTRAVTRFKGTSDAIRKNDSCAVGAERMRARHDKNERKIILLLHTISAKPKVIAIHRGYIINNNNDNCARTSEPAKNAKRIVIVMFYLYFACNPHNTR